MIFLSLVAREHLPGHKRMIECPLPEFLILNCEVRNHDLKSIKNKSNVATHFSFTKKHCFTGFAYERQRYEYKVYAESSSGTQMKMLKLSCRVLGTFYYQHQLFVSSLIFTEGCQIIFCRHTPLQGNHNKKCQVSGGTPPIL